MSLAASAPCGLSRVAVAVPRASAASGPRAARREARRVGDDLILGGEARTQRPCGVGCTAWQGALALVAGWACALAGPHRRQAARLRLTSRKAEEKDSPEKCQPCDAVLEVRAGDEASERPGESFFPDADEQKVKATGDMLASEPPMRIGHGYDIHRYLPRDKPEQWGKYRPQPTVIGGVIFEDFDLGVVANSDGDVVLHSVTDAILGALCLPDLGQFFPDNIPKWRGANSEQFLEEAVRLMKLRKYRIMSMDITVIAERPRLAPAKPRMLENVVNLCHTIPARVNLKARTHEKVDAVGELRAIECHVVAILELTA